jgi:hypothetical protein
MLQICGRRSREQVFPVIFGVVDHPAEKVLTDLPSRKTAKAISARPCRITTASIVMEMHPIQ